jgi:hypothetical protein
MSAPVLPADKFQSRDELVGFIEQQAAAAVEKAARVERRVPWVTSGPVCADSAGYSVLKAAAYALGFVGPDQAKEEIHAHQQLRDLYAGYGFSPHHGQQSFLVPLASAHLPAFEPQGRKLRDELHQKLTAHSDKYDPDEADWIGRRLNPLRKALGTLTDTAGGTMVPLPMLGELIDLQRSLEVFATAGAREVALPPNGRIQFPKLTAASTAYWVGEGSSITESQPTTGNLDLQAKKLGVFVKLSRRLDYQRTRSSPGGRCSPRSWSSGTCRSGGRRGRKGCERRRPSGAAPTREPPPVPARPSAVLRPSGCGRR